MAKSKKKSKKSAAAKRTKSGAGCSCGAAKRTLVPNAYGHKKHPMCRDVNGVTHKRNGKTRQAGSFSKAAC